MYGGNPRSTAQIAGHPLHPMLIPLPITSFIGAFATDLAFKVTGDERWATASKWLLGAGLVTAVGAAATGLADYLGDDRVRKIPMATYHMVANIGAVAIEAANLAIRLNNESEPMPDAAPWLSGAATLLLGYSGWLGGELTYRHRVGVQETRDEFSGYDDGHAEVGATIPRGSALREAAHD